MSSYCRCPSFHLLCQCSFARVPFYWHVLHVISTSLIPSLPLTLLFSFDPSSLILPTACTQRCPYLFTYTPISQLHNQVIWGLQDLSLFCCSPQLAHQAFEAPSTIGAVLGGIEVRGGGEEEERALGSRQE